jgi:hypothetical protein
MNEKPLHLLPTLAMKVGFKEALILQCLQDCLETDSHCTSVNEKTWVRRTYEDWQKNLPFWSVDTVKRIISSLEEQQFILSLKIRESQFDHGKWYTINYPQLEKIKSTPLLEKEDKYKEILINSDKHPLWIIAGENLLIQTEDQVSKKWLCEMDIIALTRSSVHLSVPNQIIKNWIINHYYTNLIKSLEDALGYPIENLHISIQELRTFGDSLSPELEEEGKTPPNHLSSSIPYSKRNPSRSTGVSS